MCHRTLSKCSSSSPAHPSMRWSSCYTDRRRPWLAAHLCAGSRMRSVGSKVLASETLSAYRKDVTAGLYGGHYERKLKHLNKQKEGKKRLKAMSLGKVQLPHKSYV